MWRCVWNDSCKSGQGDLGNKAACSKEGANLLKKEWTFGKETSWATCANLQIVRITASLAGTQQFWSVWSSMIWIHHFRCYKAWKNWLQLVPCWIWYELWITIGGICQRWQAKRLLVYACNSFTSFANLQFVKTTTSHKFSRLSRFVLLQLLQKIPCPMVKACQSWWGLVSGSGELWLRSKHNFQEVAEGDCAIRTLK